MGTRIITIGRQFGSGGRCIGERVARELGIPCYDRALIEMASKEMGVDEYDLERVDESAVSRFFSLHKSPSYTESAMDYGLPLNDNMFLIQSQIIMKLALKEDCVIMCSATIRAVSMYLSAHPEKTGKNGLWNGMSFQSGMPLIPLKRWTVRGNITTKLIRTITGAASNPTRPYSM